MITLMRCEENRTWWKKIFAVFIIIALIGSVAVLPTKAVKANDGLNELNLFYTITVEKDTPTFHVNIEVQNLNHAGKLTFGFLTVRADLEKSTSNIEVINQGKTIPITYLGNFRWQIYQNGGKLSIDYDVSKVIPAQLFSFGIGPGQVGVYIDDQGGIFWGQYVFMIIHRDVNDIKVKFNLPSDWQIVTPYIPCGQYFEVPKIATNVSYDFVRRTIYFGKMKFYSEKKVDKCTIKFGVLEEDQSFSYAHTNFLNKENDVKFSMDRVAAAIYSLTRMFGENPYPVFTVVTTFRSKDGYFYQPYILSEVQYWTPNRYDETVGHILYSWIRETFEAPVGTEYLICKGMGEFYLGSKLAYEITGKEHYLGKIYTDYLIYKGSLGTKYYNREEIQGSYYKGAVIGLYLDKLIQRETDGRKSIEDVFGYLYQKYKNTGHEVNNEDLKKAVDLITGKDNSEVFNKYVDGNEEIPVGDFIQPYKDAFPDFIKVLDSDEWPSNYHGYSIPFFVNLEIATRLPLDLPYSVLIIRHYNDFAKEIVEKENIDNLTKQKVINALNKLSKTNDCSNFFNQWKDSYGELTLDEIKDWLKSYLPYTPQNTTASFNGNTITLNWSQVQQRYLSGYYRIIGYNIYRGTKSGDEKKLTTVTSSQYIDSDIEMGKTYYYYITTIEDQPFGDGVHIESKPSQEIKVVCKDTTPPIITVTTPNDYQTVNSDTITVSGVATDNLSSIDKVAVNEDNVSVGYDGSFSAIISLTEGTNTITIIAIDKAGNKTAKTITVIYKLQIVITLKPGDPYMTVNGVKKEIDPGRGTKPVIIPKWSRTVVPIRAIVEALGGTIEWDPIQRMVTINLGDNTINLWIGKPQAEVNGVTKWIDKNHDVRPIIVNDRTMLPLRFIAESLGCSVDWNPTTRIITITRS